MTRALDARLRKLEKQVSDQEWIPIFCKDEADFEAALADKIRWGLCTEADRPRCLPYSDERFAERRAQFTDEVVAWLDGRGPAPKPPYFGRHEERVRAGFYDGTYRQ